MAIDADLLRGWLSRCQEAGLKVIRAAGCRLLPVTAGGSTLVAQDDGYWLRLSPHVASEMEASLLPLLMQKAGEGRCAVTAKRLLVWTSTLPSPGSIRWC